MNDKIKILILFLFTISILILSGCTDSGHDETFIGSWEIIKIDDMPHPSQVDTEWAFLENGTIKATTTTSKIEDIKWYKFFVNESIHQLSQIRLANNSYEVLYTYEFTQDGKQLVLTRLSTPPLLITFERI